jgi:macrolide-specific efflux system membrane fusion protein
MKHFKKTLVGLAIIAASVGAYYYNSQPEVPAYITVKAEKQDIENTVLSTGTISASKQVQVGAQVSGQIKVLNAELGQYVKAGDLIAEIDSLTQENKLKEAEASLDNYKAQLRSKEISLKRAKSYYNRQLNLFKSNAVSKEDLETAEVDLSLAEADLTQVQTQLKQAIIAVDTAKLDLGYTKISAPMDGIIVSVPVEVGQTVNSNQTTPTIVEIAQLDKMTVKSEISEGDVIKVKSGIPVYFTVLGSPNKKYHSKLGIIDPGPKTLSDSTSNSSSSSSSTDTAIYYYGSFDVDNPDSELRISMTAQVTMILDSAKDVLSIPSSALRKDGQSYFVNILDNKGLVHRQNVEVGINNNIRAEIKSGVTQDDNIVMTESRELESVIPRRMGGPR